MANRHSKNAKDARKNQHHAERTVRSQNTTQTQSAPARTEGKPRRR